MFESCRAHHNLKHFPASFLSHFSEHVAVSVHGTLWRYNV